MGHCNGRPVTHSPTLVREAERRGRTADCINVGSGIVGVDDGWRGAALRHCFGIEGPELVPGHLGLPHEERGDPDSAARSLIILPELLVLRAAHCELSAGNGNHPDGCSRAGNSLREVLKGIYHCGR